MLTQLHEQPKHHICQQNFESQISKTAITLGSIQLNHDKASIE